MVMDLQESISVRVNGEVSDSKLFTEYTDGKRPKRQKRQKNIDLNAVG